MQDNNEWVFNYPGRSYPKQSTLRHRKYEDRLVWFTLFMVAAIIFFSGVWAGSELRGYFDEWAGAVIAVEVGD